MYTVWFHSQKGWYVPVRVSTNMLIWWQCHYFQLRLRRLRKGLGKSSVVDFTYDMYFAHFLCVSRHSFTYT